MFTRPFGVPRRARSGEALMVVCAAAVLTSCAPDSPAAPLPPLDLAITGTAVIKVQAGARGVTFLEQKLGSLSEPGPERRIVLLDDRGAVSGGYSAPSGWALIDFAQHPSGETSAVLATARTVRLVRLDRFARVQNELTLIDAQVTDDPFYDDGGSRDDTAMLPSFTRDAVRLAAIGDGVAVALRTGRNAVVAYRFDYRTAGGYQRTWRTLVEPGLSMFALGVTSGSFDTFGQLENHFHVQLDADARGNVAVAVVARPFVAPVFAVHADYFQQPTDAAAGVLVTRLAPDGHRLGTTLLDTVQISELHGLRLAGDDIAVVGRVFSERRDDGSGWNAFAAHIGRLNGALLNHRVIDVDRGEVLFDVAPLAQGRFLVAGAAGYTQNPGGGSISEETAPLLAVLEPDGTVKERIDVASGPRQNQLRSLAARDGHWLVAGLVNGPGTHSSDANPALLTADGFVREMAIAVP